MKERVIVGEPPEALCAFISVFQPWESGFRDRGLAQQHYLVFLYIYIYIFVCVCAFHFLFPCCAPDCRCVCVTVCFCILSHSNLSVHDTGIWLNRKQWSAISLHVCYIICICAYTYLGLSDFGNYSKSRYSRRVLFNQGVVNPRGWGWRPLF